MWLSSTLSSLCELWQWVESKIYSSNRKKASIHRPDKKAVVSANSVLLYAIFLYNKLVHKATKKRICFGSIGIAALGFVLHVGCGKGRQSNLQS